MKADDVLLRLVKRYGVRRAMVLIGAAILVSAKGWDVLIGDEAYSRQGVWVWKRDLDAAGIDPALVEWDGFERGVGDKIGRVVEAGAEARRRKMRRESRGTSSA